MTPSWEQRKLGEFSKKKTTKNADGALSETFTNSAEQGVISQLDYFDHDITNDANISGYYVVQPDDFVYNPRISVTAPCGPINRNRLNRAGVMSPLYTVFSVDTSVDKTYLEHYFKTSRWHDFMFLEGNTGARSDRFSISDATFFEMPIWCPGVSEQMAIAKQLETTDSLITLHQRKRQYRGLCGYLSWEQRKLGDIAKEITRVIPDSSAPVMMISTPANGFIYQSEHYAFDNTGESLKKYIQLNKGELAYNHGASKMRPYGSTFVLKKDQARVPFVYHCFAVEQEDSDFVSLQLNLGSMQLQLRKLISSGARMDGLLNISYEEYMSLKLLMPSMEEQRLISRHLGALGNLITLHQREPRFADTG